MRRLALWLGCVVGLVAPLAAHGPSASVGTTALVVSVGMTITRLRDLEFGTVTRGVPTIVLPAGASAGEWQVTGAANADVSIGFTLPAALQNTQAVPGVTMPISFGAVSALWRRAVNDPVGATTFDPNVGTTGKLGPSVNPNLYIWVGGTVSPPLNQLPGIYTGTIVVRLAYL